MFIQHYLDPMFPLARRDAGDFLDRVVDVDEGTAVGREGMAIRKIGVMRRESCLEGEKVEAGAERLESGEGALGLILDEERKGKGLKGLRIEFLEQGLVRCEEARGKTVRQLSRLWRYTDGGSPAEYVPCVIEEEMGAGLGLGINGVNGVNGVVHQGEE